MWMDNWALQRPGTQVAIGDPNLNVSALAVLNFQVWGRPQTRMLMPPLSAHGAHLRDRVLLHQVGLVATWLSQTLSRLGALVEVTRGFGLKWGELRAPLDVRGQV